jgi:sugar phosphate isomerase/epimerase
MSENTNDKSRMVPVLRGPRIACRLEVLPGERILDKLTNAANFGFDAVSLPGRFLNDYLDELRRCLADSPLPFVSMSLGFSGSLLSPYEKIREQCRDSFLKLFDICAELGVAYVNVPPVLIEDNPDRITDPGPYATVEQAQDALLIEQLPDLGDQAKKRGLMFLLEPVNHYESEYLNTVPHAAKLCETLNHDHIGLTCDFFHMQLEELSIPQSLYRAGKWIKHVHVAENTRVEPGPGSLNFKPGFQTLKGLKYGGFIELECRKLSGPAEKVLPKSVEYLRRLWKQA